MEIVKGTREDVELLASLISEANRDVAGLFGITAGNTPKHPSFCTGKWVEEDFNRGEEYFLYLEDGVAKGCVAFEQPDQHTAYLNRLSVLPDFRHQGIGARLVEYICDYSKSKKIQIISIGIIAEHQLLKDWYLGLGFVEGEIKNFDHLVFNVRYMRYLL